MERVNRECSSCPMQQWPSAFYCVRIVDTSSHAVDSAHLEPIRALSCSESILLLSRRSKLIARKRKPVALRRNLHKITHRCFTVQLQPAWIYSNRTFVIVEDRFEWFHRSQLPNKKYSEIFFSLFYLFYNNNSYEFLSLTSRSNKKNVDRRKTSFVETYIVARINALLIPGRREWRRSIFFFLQWNFSLTPGLRNNGEYPREVRTKVLEIF